LHQRKRLITFYLILVLITAFLLFLRNPVPFVREDLWGEDGRDYIAGIINYGFWKALYLNFFKKGYLQFFKYLIAAFCLGINQIIFQERIIFIPQVIAITSYLTYAAVFCLPILLFHSKIKIKYLVAIAIGSCFIDTGPLDNFLVFGRILNIGFLSIHLCFLLILYRILFISKIKNSLLYLIDLIIFFCILTQPINVLLLAFIYLDILIKQVISLLTNKTNLVGITKIFNRQSISLFMLGIFTIIYFLIILASDLELESYAKTYGNSENEWYNHKFYFGKFWFNQIFALSYDKLSDFLVLLLLAVLVLFTLMLKNKLFVYCLYSLVAVSGITLYWRPGLLVVMKYVDHLKNTVYTMPSNLIFIFMSFMMLACFMERFNDLRISTLKLDNIFLCSLLGLYLATGLHTITTADFQPTISLKQGLCLAKASYSQRKNGLVKVPSNPESMDMWLPEKLVECQVNHI